MVKLKEIPRTATFAWSPHSADPLLATGTVAGAVDADFSSTTKLELWDLDLLDRSTDSFYLKPKVSIDTDARFFDIAWGAVSSDKPNGIIAGALESGVLELWDADSLIRGSQSSFARETKHTGSIKCLQFNPIQKHLIASGGINGEIFIWDINSLQNAFAPGKTPTRNSDVDAIAWNNGVAHILASGSSEGTSIWDLRNRREILHLNYQAPGTSSRNLVSSVAWHPDNSTSLITASSDEQSPVILLWDLRNANAPLKTISGHDKGVLSIDWCKHDSSLLLSSGKDSKTILWDTESGNRIGEYPTTSNWNFHASFNPTDPDIFASASFDGKINIQTIQDVNSTKPTQKKAEGDDFWNSNNYIDAQHPTVSLEKAPKWLKRPISATFGFGGKIVSVKQVDGSSIVTISKFSGDESLTSESSKLAAALAANNIPEIIKENLENTKDGSHFDWTILDLLSKKDKELIKKYIKNEEEDEQEQEGSSETKEVSSEESKDEGLFGKGTTTEDEFLSTLSLTQYKPSGTFEIFRTDYSKTDKSITKAILEGDLEKAVNIALKEDRLADAFAIAARAPEATRIKVQTAYISKNAENKSYLRLLNAISSKNLVDIAENANVSEWKETLNALYSNTTDAETFKKLASILGDRLLSAHDAGRDSSSESAELRNSAVLCYLLAENLAQVSKVWIKEIFDTEHALLHGESSTLTPYAAHVKALHSFIEKVTIFRKTCPAADNAGNKGGDGLDSLYDIYRDYANIVATQGQLDLAETYLNLLPAQYPGASLEKERVSKANKPSSGGSTGYGAKTGANVRSSFSSSYGYAPIKPAVASNPFGVSDSTSGAVPAAATPFAPSRALSPYQPTASLSGVPVTANAGVGTPSGLPFTPGQAHTQSGIYAPTNPIISPYQPQQQQPLQQQSLYGPPPTSASSLPPPPVSTQVKKTAEGWNDLPSSAIPPPRKITTPAMPAITPPTFGAQAPPNAYGPPSTPKPVSAPALGPPPTGGIVKPVSNNGAAPLSTPNTSSTPPAINDKYAPVKPSLPSGGPSQYRFNEPPISSPPPPTNPYSSPPVNPYAALSLSQNNNQVNRPVAAPLPPPPSIIGESSGYGANQGSLSSPQSYAPVPSIISGPPTGANYGAPTNNFGQAPQQPPVNPYALTAASRQQPPSQQQQPYPSQQPPIGAYGVAAPQYGQLPYQQQLQPSQQLPPQVQQPPEPEPEPEPVEPPKPSYPSGDRSHIPENSIPIYNLLSEELEVIKPHIPANYSRQFQDAEKRINILFDHLNNEDLLSDATKTDLVALAQALQAKDYNTASEIHLSILTTRSEECGHWMVGIKRLIDIVRVLVMNGMLE